MLDEHLAFCEASFALLKTGNNMAARIAMMAITTSSSINVNPRAGSCREAWLSLSLTIKI
jgi:hypothetical protein